MGTADLQVCLVCLAGPIGAAAGASAHEPPAWLLTAWQCCLSPDDHGDRSPVFLEGRPFSTCLICSLQMKLWL